MIQIETREAGLAYAYIIVGGVLILWGGSQLRTGLRPFRVRPYLLITLGIVMIYSGSRLDM